MIDQGQVLCAIVIANQADSIEQKAAEELTHWLGQMSEKPAVIPVIPESQASPDQYCLISIGRTTMWTNLNCPLKQTPLGDEGIGIAVDNGNLYLWGGRTRGIVNTVFALLEEELGCRWYTDEHTRIPQSVRVAVSPVPRTYQPPFALRDPFYYVSFNADWSLRNRTNAPGSKVSEAWGGRIDYGDAFVHTLCHRFLNREKYFKDHPDYYMLDKHGNRDSHQPCTTHPEVIRIVIDEVKASLQNNPHTEIISVSKDDGGDECLCPRCKAIADKEGTHMAPLLVLVNRVAEAIEKDHPHVVISTLAYLETVKPPKTMRPRKNVAIRLCNDFVGSWKKPFTPARDCEFGKIVRDWAEVHDCFYVWDYVTNYSHYMAPMPNMEVVADNIRFYADHHVKGVMTQAGYESPGVEREWMRSWVFSKLMWDPGRDVKALMRDFVFGHYGKAADLIWQYNENLQNQARLFSRDMEEPEDGIRYPMDHPFLTYKFLRASAALFDRAEAAAENIDVLHRVQKARLPIMYVRLGRGPDHLGMDFERAIDKFEAIARRENVTHLAEHYSNLDEQIGIWRLQWKAYKEGH